MKENGLADVECQDAFDGNEAVWQVHKFKPDLILLDVEMPERDGISALELIKKNDPNIIVIMVSSHGSKTMISKATSLGANGFIQKPFDKDELCSCIRKVLP